MQSSNAHTRSLNPSFKLAPSLRGRGRKGGGSSIPQHHPHMALNPSQDLAHRNRERRGGSSQMQQWRELLGKERGKHPTSLNPSSWQASSPCSPLHWNFWSAHPRYSRTRAGQTPPMAPSVQRLNGPKPSGQNHARRTPALEIPV
jgi:hypothetical protein